MNPEVDDFNELVKSFELLKERVESLSKGLRFLQAITVTILGAVIL